MKGRAMDEGILEGLRVYYDEIGGLLLQGWCIPRGRDVYSGKGIWTVERDGKTLGLRVLSCVCVII